MIGKLLGVFGDAKAPRAAEANAALGYILQITGGDAVNINRKYADEISNLYLNIRFMMAMNGLPTFSDDSMAFANRALPFRFEKSWEGHEDWALKPHMIQMAKEGNLINWALRGLRDLRQEGQFTIPERSRAIIDQIRGVNSQVRTFVGEVCKLDVTEKVECNLLYKVWKAWCEDQGLRPGSRDQFGRRLNNAYEGIDRRRVRVDKQGTRSYVYHGLGLDHDAIDEYLD